MDELVKLVSQKTGITQDQARTAVTTVLEFIKGRLPAPLAGQIDNILGGANASKDQAGLGGLFGGKK